MSVINKMLQDLDRRNAAGTEVGDTGAQAVRAVGPEQRRHEWFWRVLALLLLVSVGWVGWVAYQLQPRPLVTPLALVAAKPSRAAPQEKPAPPAAAPVAAPPAMGPIIEAPKPEPVHPAAELPAAEPVKSVETLKLARSIDRPINPPSPKAGKAAKAVDQQPIAASKVVVDKREGPKVINEAAEARFRRAAALLNQGRVSEAEEQLAAALQADANHVAARQAYVALLLEQQRVASALRLLREAVETDPGQPTFALGLARIYAEQRDYAAALSVIDKAGAATLRADFQVLRGAVLQRLGRHAEAVTAYQEALQKSSQPGGTWAGLGVSLEAVGRHGEAAQAYKRALALGPLAQELRAYAEDRLRALQ